MVGDQPLATELTAFEDTLYYCHSGELYSHHVDSEYKWRSAVGQFGIHFDSHPAVDGERVYLSSTSEDHDDQIIAIPTGEHSSQEPVWSQTDYSNVQTIAPTIIGDTLWVGRLSGEEALIALDAGTGDPRMAIEGWGITAEPAIRHGRVYASIAEQGAEPRPTAFDAETGEELWKAEKPAGDSAPVAGERLLFYNGATVQAEGGKKRTVVALDAETGEQEWSRKVTGEGVLSFALTDGTLYVPEIETELYALDADTGEERWTVDIGSQATSEPCVANGVVYIGAGDGHLYALDAETGEQRWRLKVTEGAISRGPIVVGDRVFTDGGVQDRGLSESYTVASIE
jgi:outer membrane protein assembly factor BamB